MKKMYFVLVLLCISLQSLSAVEFDKTKLPKLLGSSNMGREFYFSFIPAWETDMGDLNIYISSTVRSKVIVEVPEKGYKKTKYTIPNDIIEFSLRPSSGQPNYYTRPHNPPEPENIYRGCGIHVFADDPIICYGVTRYDYTSDGFLALPVNALGKEYIISSYPDVATNTDQWLPSEFTVTAPYDSTKVLFTMGGTSSSSTAGGQKTGKTTTWNLNKGDVLLVSSLGHLADLTGSKIEASKPVAVVSGSFCAYVPTDCGNCDFIMDMELPTESWGTQYHVTPIVSRLKNSMIRVFAKEPNTEIYRDNDFIGTIKNAGGISGTGWLDMRADTGRPRPITIHSDKAISVTQYNTGQLDDEISSDPFQMVLVPTEQYQNEITFNTPGIRGGFGFPQNYINLCYEATDSNTIPEDMEFAEVEGGQFVWHSLKELTQNPGDSFSIVNNKKYFSKFITLPGDGVYKIKANNPFQAYSYGFSYCDSYGFPASVALRSNDYNDIIPPQPEWTMNCSGDVNTDSIGFVYDKANNGSKSSGLSMIYLMSDSSYNYTLDYGAIMSAEDSTTWWKLYVIDKRKNARAFIRFIDRADNDTIIAIDYKSPLLSTSDTLINLRARTLDTLISHPFYLSNLSMDTLIIDNIFFKSNKNNDSDHLFMITRRDNIPIKNILILPNENLEFFIVSNPNTLGMSYDTIYADIRDYCSNFFLSKVIQRTGTRILNVTDITFPNTYITAKSLGSCFVTNKGTLDLTLNYYSRDSWFANYYKLLNDSVFKNIWNDEMVLKPNDSIQMFIEFLPTDTNIRIADIYFSSNSDTDDYRYDSIAVFTGKGVKQPVIIQNLSFGRNRVNTKIFPSTPITKTLKIYNKDTSSLKIMSINADYYSKNFIFDSLDFIGKTIAPGDSIETSISFLPLDYNHINSRINLIFNREWYDFIGLNGTGTIGFLTPGQFMSNFDTAYVDYFQDPVKKEVILYNSTKDSYSDTILVIDVFGDDINSSMDNWDSTSFRYDKKSLNFPFYLAPGKSFKVPIEFVPRHTGLNTATFHFISSSKYNDTCNHTIRGYGKINTEISEFNLYDIKFYPNPTEDILIIDKLPLNTKKIQVFDEQGKEVRSIDNKNQSESLKISTKDLPVGVYVLRMFVGSEVVDKKFVIYR